MNAELIVASEDDVVQDREAEGRKDRRWRQATDRVRHAVDRKVTESRVSAPRARLRTGAAR